MNCIYSDIVNNFASNLIGKIMYYIISIKAIHIISKALCLGAHLCYVLFRLHVTICT